MPSLEDEFAHYDPRTRRLLREAFAKLEPPTDFETVDVAEFKPPKVSLKDIIEARDAVKYTEADISRPKSMFADPWAVPDDIKVYTDLSNRNIPRIMEETNRDYDEVWELVNRARWEDQLSIRIKVRPKAPEPPPVGPWDEFWREWKYKRSFTFKYNYDIDRNMEYIFVSCIVEDVYNPGVYAPVQGNWDLPRWINEDVAAEWARELMITFEQHETDEWITYKGKRLFDPHATKNAHRQTQPSSI